MESKESLGRALALRELITELAGNRITYKNKLLMDQLDIGILKTKIREKAGRGNHGASVK